MWEKRLGGSVRTQTLLFQIGVGVGSKWPHGRGIWTPRKGPPPALLLQLLCSVQPRTLAAPSQTRDHLTSWDLITSLSTGQSGTASSSLERKSNMKPELRVDLNHLSKSSPTAPATLDPLKFPPSRPGPIFTHAVPSFQKGPSGTPISAPPQWKSWKSHSSSRMWV